MLSFRVFDLAFFEVTLERNWLPAMIDSGVSGFEGWKLDLSPNKQTD